jgi:hypothetical protein
VAGDKETKVDEVGPFAVAKPFRFGDAATWGAQVGDSLKIIQDSY